MSTAVRPPAEHRVRLGTFGGTQRSRSAQKLCTGGRGRVFVGDCTVADWKICLTAPAGNRLPGALFACRNQAAFLSLRIGTGVESCVSTCVPGRCSALRSLSGSHSSPAVDRYHFCFAEPPPRMHGPCEAIASAETLNSSEVFRI